MHPIRRHAWALVALLAAPVAAIAGEPPAIGPQWVATFWRDVVASDRLASTVNPTWFRTDDGGAIVVTLDRHLLMRRFSGDGSIRQAQWLRPEEIHLGEGIDRVAVAAHPSAPGFYLLVRSQHCRLVRSSPEFRPRWSVPVALPLSIAGLSGRSPIVMVGPPLNCRPAKRASSGPELEPI